MRTRLWVIGGLLVCWPRVPAAAQETQGKHLRNGQRRIRASFPARPSRSRTSTPASPAADDEQQRLFRSAAAQSRQLPGHRRNAGLQDACPRAASRFRSASSSRCQLTLEVGGVAERVDVTAERAAARHQRRSVPGWVRTEPGAGPADALEHAGPARPHRLGRQRQRAGALRGAGIRRRAVRPGWRDRRRRAARNTPSTAPPTTARTGSWRPRRTRT